MDLCAESEMCVTHLMAQEYMQLHKAIGYNVDLNSMIDSILMRGDKRNVYDVIFRQVNKKSCKWSGRLNKCGVSLKE